MSRVQRSPPQTPAAAAAVQLPESQFSASEPDLAQIKKQQLDGGSITIRNKRPRLGDDDDADPLQALLLEVRLLRADMQETRDEMREFRRETQEFRSALGACDQRIDAVERRLDDIEKRVADAVVTMGTHMLEETITNLQLELNDRDQDLLANDVEFTKVKEVSGENPVHLVSLLAVKLGVTLDERDVVSAVRVGAPPAAGEGHRHRPLVVRLARRATRDALMRAARVRRTATTTDLGLPGEPQKFYVNERLTKLNRVLFAKAREQAQAHGWRWVWTREGRVLARRAEGQPYHRIRKESDIKRIFGGDKVGSPKA